MFARKILGAILLFFIIAISSPVWLSIIIMRRIVCLASSTEEFLGNVMEYIGDKLRVEDLANWVDGPKKTARKQMEANKDL